MPKDGDAELMNRWKVQDALETYGCRHWGKGYFSISKSGHVTVHPNKRSDQAIGGQILHPSFLIFFLKRR